MMRAGCPPPRGGLEAQQQVLPPSRPPLFILQQPQPQPQPQEILRPPHLILQHPQRQEIEFATPTPSPEAQVVPTALVSTFEGPVPTDTPANIILPDRTTGGATTEIRPPGLAPTDWSLWPPMDGRDCNMNMNINEFLNQDLSSSVLPFAPDLWNLDNAGSTDGGSAANNDDIFAAGAAAAAVGIPTTPEYGLWYGQHIGGGYGSDDGSVKPPPPNRHQPSPLPPPFPWPNPLQLSLHRPRLLPRLHALTKPPTLWLPTMR